GQTGWGRDDLLDVFGDGTAFGYGQVPVQTFAFPLRRQAVAAPVTPVVSAPVTPAVTPATPVMPAAPVPATPSTVSAAQLTTVSVTTSPAPTPGTTPASPTTTPAAPLPSPAPVPAPVTPTAPTTPTTGAPMAMIKTQGGANTRTGPGTNFDRTGIVLERHSRHPILAVQQEQTGQKYRWFKLDAKGKQLWIREDLVTYDGDTAALGLPTDLYPEPMKDKYWWVRGFNLAPNLDTSLPAHDGWDLGAANGEPMYAGPNGGLVVKSFQCAKCTADRPSTLTQGFSLGDPSIFNDPGWGNGYGNYVIVGYTNDKLPKSTRDLLASKGFPGGAIFVMYAHLATRMVEAGAVLSGGQQIGTCGNTGNSEAPHVHLEIRASKSPTFSEWFNIRSGVMDAVALFRR
ncbi:MAG: peptidoglycan DD-metalloendopeptidase family protein, partial [Anaerolineae bacterium]|nr:peptidoglycan DD-metalloendopeptidase family protein [Anaerolineae bacterium]